jgi:tryptophanyl-tRNA synthetase
MERLLTGIQSSGKPHLGNILGSMKPAITLSNKISAEPLFFIADLHSLTTIKNGNIRKQNIEDTAKAWIACGLDPSTSIFYRQSMIPEITELTWYLASITKYPMLANAHSFKSKSEKLADVNVGLFTYPILMASDILTFNATVIPVGKDQKQHIEMARDIASSFNMIYAPIFNLPNPVISESVMTIPGIDGQKMSKSYKNTIDIFGSKHLLKNQIASIKSDNTGIKEKKSPENCIVFTLYKYVASSQQIIDLAEKYKSGSFSSKEAKKLLYHQILSTFEKERDTYENLNKDKGVILDILEDGEVKARKIARPILDSVRETFGFGKVKNQ